MRGAPARSCINPWSLPGESTPRAPPPGRQQCVHLEVGLFELQRRRVGRVGQPRAQPALERRLGAVARDEHAVEPQSFFSADEPVADARAQRRDRNRRRLGGSPFASPSAIATAATCSQGLTREGQSHSHSFSVG